MELLWTDLKFKLYRAYDLALDYTTEYWHYMSKKSNAFAYRSHVLHCLNWPIPNFKWHLQVGKMQIFCLVLHLVTHFLKAKDLKLWVSWLGNDHVPSLESGIYKNEHIHSLIHQLTQRNVIKSKFPNMKYIFVLLST